MSAVEYKSWVAYYAEEPFGDVRADLRAGVVAATVAGTVSRRGVKHRPIDFMPIVKALRDKSLETHAGRNRAIRQEFETGLGLLALRLRHTTIKRENLQ